MCKRQPHVTQFGSAVLVQNSTGKQIMTKRIIFTGGTGKAGRHAVPYLLSKGYSILNVDLKPLDLH